MRREHMSAQTARTAAFFQFFHEEQDAGRTMIHYDGWWGHDTLPKLNYEDSPKLV